MAKRISVFELRQMGFNIPAHIPSVAGIDADGITLKDISVECDEETREIRGTAEYEFVKPIEWIVITTRFYPNWEILYAYEPGKHTPYRHNEQEE